MNSLNIELSDKEFLFFKTMVFDEVGITLNNSKKILVASRLLKRLLHFKLNNYAQYIKILQENSLETTKMINLITTNETYFFREHAHFEFLEKIAKESSQLRVWSAASSIGAEAYSTAFILDTYIDSSSWQVMGSDINSEVIDQAKKGLYSENLVEKIPSKYKNKYCLKGSDNHEGEFIIDRKLTKKVDFFISNLLNKNSSIGEFDIIFLRNVLIYFDNETKEIVIENILHNLKIGGYLIISLTENLQFLKSNSFKQIKNSIYQRIK
ncbi:MAG: protein-glutamate O-methyltransferase CheR [Helicobacteraceae bacterium]|nr:protein-glutamate O-methyltransferase CheR [Helicobacteraceae bacterium]